MGWCCSIKSDPGRTNSISSWLVAADRILQESLTHLCGSLLLFHTNKQKKDLFLNRKEVFAELLWPFVPQLFQSLSLVPFEMSAKWQDYVLEVFPLILQDYLLFFFFLFPHSNVFVSGGTRLYFTFTTFFTGSSPPSSHPYTFLLISGSWSYDSLAVWSRE